GWQARISRAVASRLASAPRTPAPSTTKRASASASGSLRVTGTTELSQRGGRWSLAVTEWSAIVSPGFLSNRRPAWIPAPAVGAGDRRSGREQRVWRVHGARRALAAGAAGAEARVLEDFAHRIDAEDAVLVCDQRGDLRRLVGVVLFLPRIEEVLLLEDRMQL